MPATDTKVLVLARAPEPGAAKTRLIPRLGPTRAAALQRVLTEQTLRTALAAAIGDVELWCAPSQQHPGFAAYRQEFDIAFASQCEGDLGTRMLDAARSTLAHCSRVIILGTDCPALTPNRLQEAAHALGQANDAVLIPAEDGGYVLIGLKSAHERVFAGIDWGSSDVMRATRAGLRGLDWRWVELAASWDVDRAADFDRLAASGLIADLDRSLSEPTPAEPGYER